MFIAVNGTDFASRVIMYEHIVFGASSVSSSISREFSLPLEIWHLAANSFSWVLPGKWLSPCGGG